ncbi:MAG: BlaI/MecI/CopY family transcriptional regulator [Gemmatimonadales bacterium]|nr:BlaI/MecI/CopY family transcriptional regulator [Gemmatimonadales bacterium]
MSNKSKLTPVEWEVMQTVWDLADPITVRDVLEHLHPNGGKAYTTIQTVMNILEKKKLLSRRKIGLVNFYTPTLSRDDISRSEISRVVEGIFSGSIAAVASTLMSLDDFDLNDLAEIRALLAQREDELKGESNGHSAE